MVLFAVNINPNRIYKFIYMFFTVLFIDNE
ncbi:MAG: hypothetical protein RLZZ420_2079 [Bacteroidota bacterium]|jgi:hypothetical protein